jgi:hypothetical protein
MTVLDQTLYTTTFTAVYALVGSMLTGQLLPATQFLVKHPDAAIAVSAAPGAAACPACACARPHGCMGCHATAQLGQQRSPVTPRQLCSAGTTQLHLPGSLAAPRVPGVDRCLDLACASAPLPPAQVLAFSPTSLATQLAVSYTIIPPP